MGGPTEAITTRAAYTLGALATAIGVHKSTIFRVIRSGELRAKKLGGRTIIPACEVDRWLDSLPDRELAGPAVEQAKRAAAARNR
jgi:excisionase family DNA binding protein